MIWVDFINGLYESLGGILVWLSIYRLYKDKEVKGVSIFASIFFTSWGYWNLFYYSFLGQWFSFFGAGSLAIANLVWVILAIYYIRKNKKKQVLHG